MYVIYKVVNKTNNKIYIGQTKDLEQRKRNHKSDSFNTKSSGYLLPFHNAIRKYGWDNFEWTILEEIPEEESQEYIDQREKYFIQLFDSLTINDKGYNICEGGQGNPQPKLSYEENLKINSKLFTPEEIKDIQNLLRNGEEYGEILEKYSPKLTPSFLSNINNGYNYKNSEWTYPLLKCNTSNILSKRQQKELKEEIKQGVQYKVLSKKYGVGIALISMINTGKVFFDESEEYPLCNKGCRKQDNEKWVKEVIKDLIFSSLNLKEIAEKYGKGYATIKNINAGRSHKRDNLIYPLNKNKEQNLNLF